MATLKGQHFTIMIQGCVLDRSNRYIDIVNMTQGLDSLHNRADM